jgi:hypothetical protein
MYFLVKGLRSAWAVRIDDRGRYAMVVPVCFALAVRSIPYSSTSWA